MNNDYLKIPESVLGKSNICASSKILYGYISLLCHQNGFCYATNGFLGKTLNVTPRTITRLVKELKDANLITISYTDDRVRRIYLV